MALVVWKTIDPNGNPIAALYQATSPTMGQWQAQGDKCGNTITNLGPGDYTVSISSPGYDSRVISAHIQDCGIITSRLEYAYIVPTRDQIINVQGNFCNLFDDDDIPMWDAYLSSLLVTGQNAKFDDWITRFKKAGTTHINMPISYNYPENLGWTDKYPIPGQDFYKTGLDGFLRIVKNIQSLGFIPIIKLAYDGQAYDSFGWTYGWQYGISNFESTVVSLAELHDVVLWSTGYDGCFPAWSAQQTTQMLQKMRAVLGPDGCIDTEFAGPGSVGYCHMGNGPSDWTPDKLGILDSFSIEVFTVPPDATGVQQVASRMLGPNARNIEPANLGPWYLKQMSGVKQINVGWYETCAYQAIRKQITSVSAIQSAQAIERYGGYSFGNGQP